MPPVSFFCILSFGWAEETCSDYINPLDNIPVWLFWLNCHVKYYLPGRAVVHLKCFSPSSLRFRHWVELFRCQWLVVNLKLSMKNYVYKCRRNKNKSSIEKMKEKCFYAWLNVFSSSWEFHSALLNICSFQSLTLAISNTSI